MPPMTLMDQIGRYQILGELGRGAMGVVYRAQDPAIGRVVAIKTIRLKDIADGQERERLRERLFREAQSAGVLSHPNIVTIFDIAEEGGVAYVAMELVDGPALDQLLAEEAIGGSGLLQLLSQTAAALDYAHKRGIIHRDIKPSNILVHERLTAKIADFGVAKIQSQQMTQAGTLIGTPNYMSPEQIQGDTASGKSDQFSLAVIAYELMAGQKPFLAESFAALLYKIVKEPAVAVHTLNPSLSWTVDTVLQRALAKNADERYPTCSDFLRALENACKASKGWQPMALSAMNEADTVVQTNARTVPVTEPERPLATVAPAAVIPPVFSGYAEPEESIEEPSPKPPLVLRMLRTAALLVLGAGLVFALVAGWRTFTAEEEKTASGPQPPAVERPTFGGSGAQPGEAAKTSEAAKATETPKGPERTDSDVAAPEFPVPAATIPEARQVPFTDTRLLSAPLGARVIIDGKTDFGCNTPCTLKLTKGRHTAIAMMDGFRRTEQVIDTPRDREVMLRMGQSSGTLMVRSEPRGANITIDGQARPEKTPAILTIPPGQYSIEIEREGSKRAEKVTVKDGSITNVFANFDQP